jgi:hypothetical protein
VKGIESFSDFGIRISNFSLTFIIRCSLSACRQAGSLFEEFDSPRLRPCEEPSTERSEVQGDEAILSFIDGIRLLRRDCIVSRNDDFESGRGFNIHHSMFPVRLASAGRACSLFEEFASPRLRPCEEPRTERSEVQGDEAIPSFIAGVRLLRHD